MLPVTVLWKHDVTGSCWWGEGCYSLFFFCS